MSILVRVQVLTENLLEHEDWTNLIEKHLQHHFVSFFRQVCQEQNLVRGCFENRSTSGSWYRYANCP